MLPNCHEKSQTEIKLILGEFVGMHTWRQKQLYGSKERQARTFVKYRNSRCLFNKIDYWHNTNGFEIGIRNCKLYRCKIRISTSTYYIL